MLLVFSNKVLLQWGFAWNPTLPIAFTKISRLVGVGISWGFAVAVQSLSLTNVTFHQWQSANGSGNASAVYWLAMGY